MDGPDAVVAAAADGEDGETPEQPGDVVDEHPVATEQDGRAQDGVRHAGLGQSPFDQSLASEVGVGRINARVGDAHVDHALDAGATGGVEQGAGILDSPLVVARAVGEADPVGVVERGRAAHAGDHPGKIVEVEWMDVDVLVVTGALRMAGERRHPPALPDQLGGDGPTRIAEGSGDDVESGVGQGAPARLSACGYGHGVSLVVVRGRVVVRASSSTAS